MGCVDETPQVRINPIMVKLHGCHIRYLFAQEATDRSPRKLGVSFHVTSSDFLGFSGSRGRLDLGKEGLEEGGDAGLAMMRVTASEFMPSPSPPLQGRSEFDR